MHAGFQMKLRRYIDQQFYFAMTIIYTCYNTYVWHFINKIMQKMETAAVAQWVRAVAPQADGWVFESQPRQT